MSEDFFTRHKLQPVINAAGTMTGLGANRIIPEAAAAMAEVAPHFVSIDELQARAGAAIARATGAEFGCMTACSASGMTLAVAACITGPDPAKIEQLPDTTGMPNGVLLQAGHAVNYGAPVEQAIRLAGGRVVYVGGATESRPYQLRAQLQEGRIAASLYVVSHHAAMEGMISLSEWVAICHEYNVPVIADMASEFNLGVAKTPGADIAIYSGHKFLGGPTSGIVAARMELARAIYLQNRGIGRQMKIGKESIWGAIAALEAWARRDEDGDLAKQKEVLSLWRSALEGIPGLQAEIIPDWTGNPIDRLQISALPDEAGFYAWELAEELRAKAPPIFVREQFLEHGRLVLDPCYLAKGEAELVARRIQDAATRLQKNGKRMSWDDYKRQEDQAAAQWPPREYADGKI